MVWVCLIWNLTSKGTIYELNPFWGIFAGWGIWQTILNVWLIIDFQFIFTYFQKQGSVTNLNSENIGNAFETFLDTISKCIHVPCIHYGGYPLVVCADFPLSKMQGKINALGQNTEIMMSHHFFYRSQKKLFFHSYSDICRGLHNSLYFSIFPFSHRPAAWIKKLI